jgi:hypothetical protein
MLHPTVAGDVVAAGASLFSSFTFQLNLSRF